MNDDASLRDAEELTEKSDSAAHVRKKGETGELSDSQKEGEETRSELGAGE
jgi:hypothetical protein